ncbi:hypothetical protein PP352_21340 [Mycobacteroides abscessus]|nr:hypothetical protein [Mycobacteroides abscessus]
MSTNQPPPPAFVITFDAPVTLFAINDEAFNKWIAESDPDEGYWSLPSTNSENPSGDVYRMLDEAEENGVITSDPRLELQFRGDEDTDGSGYWVFVANRAGEQRQIALSAGWSELDYPDDDADLADAAREQLARVINQANSVLPQP